MISAPSAFHRCPRYIEWPGTAPRPGPNPSIFTALTGIPAVNGGPAGAGPPLGTLAQPEGLALRPTIAGSCGIPGSVSLESPKSCNPLPARSCDGQRNAAIVPSRTQFRFFFLRSRLYPGHRDSQRTGGCPLELKNTDRARYFPHNIGFPLFFCMRGAVEPSTLWGLAGQNGVVWPRARR